MSWKRPELATEWQRGFGERLRAMRVEAGLSQMALSHLADLDPTYISAIEQGRRNVSLVNIHVLSGALGVSPAAFFVEPTARDDSAAS